MSRLSAALYYNRKRHRNAVARSSFSLNEGYGALFNGDPLDGGTEVTTDVIGAGRPEITIGEEIDFGDSDGAATVTWIAVYDAVSSGNYVASLRLPTTHSIKAGDTVKIHHGILSIT